MFSPVRLPNFAELKTMGLAPMAVVPNKQKLGIGSALIRSGLEKCRELGFGVVVVLGHPNYYPRFGFTPAKDFAIGCEYGPSDDSFMLAELQAGYLRSASEIVKYQEAFRDV
jgi:putative acetyltransferase